VEPSFIAPDKLNEKLAIPGLEFCENLVAFLGDSQTWFSSKVCSSPGPLVSDFVTHGPEFEYSTLGIHIGQDDRLTFFGSPEQLITGHFVDCRAVTSTPHLSVSYTFHASARRRLVIPRGVAHTFDGLAGIVTRDEPVWYSGENNPHWNVNNDLISILRTATDFPTVPTNEFKLSEDLHVYMTRLSQSVLDDPRAYSTRFKLSIDGEEKYVMFQETTWDHDGRALQPLIDAAQGPGISARRSKYAITGKASWTLVPNTGSGVSDVLLLKARTNLGDSSDELFVHRRTRKWYTFLTEEGAEVVIRAIDLRPSSPTFMARWCEVTISDPRVSLVIEPGVAYCFSVGKDVWVRSETEVFVGEDEPRSDIPPFAQDIEVIIPNRIADTQPSLPELRCPDRVVRQMAHFEGQVMADHIGGIHA
jgi:dTDP-4-dehydrorhamnose 3,5-epimerase-like enzyme